MANKRINLIGAKFIDTKSKKEVIAIDYNATDKMVLVQDDTHIYWVELDYLKLIESISFIVKVVKWIISLFKK